MAIESSCQFGLTHVETILKALVYCGNATLETFNLILVNKQHTLISKQYSYIEERVTWRIVLFTKWGGGGGGNG